MQPSAELVFCMISDYFLVHMYMCLFVLFSQCYGSMTKLHMYKIKKWESGERGVRISPGPCNRYTPEIQQE